MAPKYCPICTLRNKRNRLVLRQINLRLAVYLCEDKNCTYPEGYDVVQVEPRSMKELSDDNKKQQAGKTDLDSWLDDFFANEGEIKNSQTKHGDTVNDDDLSKIINEISECGNENELDSQYENDLFSWVDSAFNQCSLSSNAVESQESDDLNGEVNLKIRDLKGKRVDKDNVQIASTASSKKYSDDNKQNNVETPKYHILNFELFKNPSYTNHL